jgi:Fe-S-cluster containining protein
MCCELPAIAPLQKPQNVLCQHAVRGAGCTIYENRPEVCRTFNCHWKQVDYLGEEWRPDRCHFYMQQPNDKILVVLVDPAYPDAWRREPFYGQMKSWALAVLHDEAEMYVVVGERTFAIFPEEDLDAGPPELGGEVSMTYIREPGMRRPAVARRDAEGKVTIVARGKLYKESPAAPA